MPAAGPHRPRGRRRDSNHTMVTARLAERVAEDGINQRRAAEQDEHARFNATCARGGPAPLQTRTGLRLVWRVTLDWWYICGPNETTAPALTGQNDGTWAALLQR